MVNTLSVGDKILMFETGHFSTLWYDIAEKFGLEIDFIKGDWRTGVDPNIVEQKLKEDKEKKIKAVCAVHNETSTGVTSRIGEIRKAMDNALSIAFLISPILLVTPVEVSLCTAQTALIFFSLSSFNFCSTIFGSTPVLQSPLIKSISNPNFSAISYQRVEK